MVSATLTAVPHRDFAEARAIAPYGYCVRCGATLDLAWQEDRERPTCTTCGFVWYLDPKVAVAVIIGNENGVLLGLRNINPGKDRWSFPAGYVNRGEVLEEAAVREVREELQISVRLTSLVGVYSAAEDPVVLVVYSAEITEGEPTADGREVQRAAWHALGDLPDMAFPHDRRVISDWNRQLCPRQSA